MCWALYLASDRVLPLVSWNEEHPSFNTQVLSETELPVKKQFSLPNVIYLGSHQGCGCGFMTGEDGDSEERAAHQNTILALTSYLDSLLQQGAKLEMFLCWEGDQSEAPVAKKSVTMRDFFNPRFPLGEKDVANVIT